jgi:2-keto-4-pentenoate hydratase/2-oxohepta-3-ene-1,7-dioic acid hydratase in catechol pathway
LELVIHIAKPYKAGSTVDDLVDSMALGIDFTLRDLQSKLKAKGQPWLAAKGFLHSAPISEFRAFTGARKLADTEFALRKNGKEVQRGNVSRMIFDLQQIIDYTAAHFGLGPGDIIFTGTPEGVGPACDGDKLELLWGDESMGRATVRMTP